MAESKYTTYDEKMENIKQKFDKTFGDLAGTLEGEKTEGTYQTVMAGTQQIAAKLANGDFKPVCTLTFQILNHAADVLITNSKASEALQELEKIVTDDEGYIGMVKWLKHEYKTKIDPLVLKTLTDAHELFTKVEKDPEFKETIKFYKELMIIKDGAHKSIYLIQVHLGLINHFMGQILYAKEKVKGIVNQIQRQATGYKVVKALGGVLALGGSVVLAIVTGGGSLPIQLGCVLSGGVVTAGIAGIPIIDPKRAEECVQNLEVIQKDLETHRSMVEENQKKLLEIQEYGEKTTIKADDVQTTYGADEVSDQDISFCMDEHEKNTLI